MARYGLMAQQIKGARLPVCVRSLALVLPDRILHRIQAGYGRRQASTWMQATTMSSRQACCLNRLVLSIMSIAIPLQTAGTGCMLILMDLYPPEVCLPIP